MPLIDQRGMRRCRGFDSAPGSLRVGVERNRDDFEPLRVKLVAQIPPDRQVEPAASPGCPGN